MWHGHLSSTLFIWSTTMNLFMFLKTQINLLLSFCSRPWISPSYYHPFYFFPCTPCLFQLKNRLLVATIQGIMYHINKLKLNRFFEKGKRLHKCWLDWKGLYRLINPFLPTGQFLAPKLIILMKCLIDILFFKVLF